MNKELLESGRIKTAITYFDNILELHEHLTKEKGFNMHFKNANDRSSMKSGYDGIRFTTTKSFEEALDLLKQGDSFNTQNILNQMSKIKVADTREVVKKLGLDIAGYQCCVPTYLNNQPNSMFNKTRTVKKDKVITLVKLSSYPVRTTADEIIKYNALFLNTVKMIEQQGYRCNIELLHASIGMKTHIITRVKVKDASERLNVSKLAFVLVNPSYSRRCMFRRIELDEHTTSEFSSGYGLSCYTKEKLNTTLYKVNSKHIIIESMFGEKEQKKLIDDVQSK